MGKLILDAFVISDVCVLSNLHIGQGKFSYVFKAKNVESGNLVALKLIKIFDMENEKQRDNCLKEVQLHSVRSQSLFLLYTRHYHYYSLSQISLMIDLDVTQSVCDCGCQCEGFSLCLCVTI